MRFDGIHHVTCITGDAPGNVDFYTRVLGLRLVKKSVNQDDPTVYHLFYADEEGHAGSDITFFEYPNARRQLKPGWDDGQDARHTRVPAVCDRRATLILSTLPSL
jgi:catechol 2,3-dioxygenase-like lactoylglutathione lyase family enzyme